MALQEEYEYAAFRCAFCNFFNPAKKLRPLAPRLASEVKPSVNIQRPSTSSESSSGSRDFQLGEEIQLLIHFLLDSNYEISNTKKSDITEDLAKSIFKQSDAESESIVADMEIFQKPERFDIEKKLE